MTPRSDGPAYADDHVTLWHGDCREVLAGLPEASIHAVVTDPPYELGFMGKGWDSSGIAYDPAVWAACQRVLKPGGHLLAFGGTRTYHRMTAAIEDAGFEIRDCITWIYGSGFPKSLDVSKAIDKAAGATREVVGAHPWAHVRGDGSATTTSTYEGGAESRRGSMTVTAPATPDAATWAGYGTALKPASEPIVVARKPIVGTVAANVLAHGTGALNIDGCRVAGAKPDTTRGASVNASSMVGQLGAQGRILDDGLGRWPANVVLTHHPDCAATCDPACPVAELDRQSGVSVSKASAGRNGRDQAEATWGLTRSRDDVRGHTDAGGASRFFPVFKYEPKAPTLERPRVGGVAHSTVKPLDLMRWLVRLVTPPGGICLDPFAGSGTTAEACVIEGFRCVAVELDATHLPLIRARLTKPIQPCLFGTE